jgi:mannose-6-phosphate isomerase-like protein (cupin superfamily)
MAVQSVVNETSERIFELASKNLGDLQGHSVALVELDPNKTSKMHYHPNPNFEEVYVIIQGTAKMELDDKEFLMKQYDTVVIKPNVHHKISNIGKELLKMIVTCSPPWTPDCSVFVEEK